MRVMSLACKGLPCPALTAAFLCVVLTGCAVAQPKPQGSGLCQAYTNVMNGTADLLDADAISVRQAMMVNTAMESLTQKIIVDKTVCQ